MPPRNIVAATGILAPFSRWLRKLSTSRLIAPITYRIFVGAPAEPCKRDQVAQYERRTFSQHGEDGILKEICLRLGLVRGFFVEFGVQDGLECNTRVFAESYQWNGLYIEGDEKHSASLRALYSGNSAVRTCQAFITRENIARIFAENAVPEEFDILSIDVDGNDFWFWRALAVYRPKVVVIEYNGAYPPPHLWIMNYHPEHVWDGSTYFGASLSAMSELGNTLGYALLGTESTGINAFFIRRDLLPSVGFEELSAEEAYRKPRYGFLGVPYPYQDGPCLEGEIARDACRLPD